jgi:two-component system nitrogen regulation response regulator GlnG
MKSLLEYSWPGNVRELENAIKRALVLSSADLLTPEDFAFLAGESPKRSPRTLTTLVEEEVGRALDAGDGEAYRRIIEEVERPLLETALARTEGNQIRAAALLGINRNTLRKKIAELGIRVPGRR